MFFKDKQPFRFSAKLAYKIDAHHYFIDGEVKRTSNIIDDIKSETEIIKEARLKRLDVFYYGDSDKFLCI